MTRPLTDADLWDADRCPVCDASTPRPVIMTANDTPRVDWLACPVCRAASLSRMPCDDYLDTLYEGYYDRDRRSPDVDDAIWRKLAHRISREIGWGGTRPGPIRILDFGGGRGGVALAVAKQLAPRQPATVTIVDRSFQHDHQASAEQGVAVERVRSLAQVEGKFELVIASAVLEHVPRLAPVLGDLLGKMSESGGAFYARTPYALPLRTLYPGYDMLFPQHVHDLGPSFWNRLMARHGIRARTVVSRPSIVESFIWDRPLATLAASLLKIPGRIERWIRRSPTDYLWRWVGGWELFVTRS